MAEPSKRRRPDAAGLAGLSEQDRDDWLASRKTAVEIAGRLGVSKQALSAEFRRRGWRKIAPKIAVPAAVASPVSSGAPTAGPIAALPSYPVPVFPDTMEGLREHVGFLLGHADLVLLELTARELDRARADPLHSYGPTALKSAATALETIRANLVAGRLLDAHENAPPELIVRVMTPEEANAAQEAAENAVGADEHMREQQTAEPSEPPNATATERRATAFLDGPLPATEHLKGWLLGIGQRLGAVSLRRLLRELSGTEPGLGTSQQQVVERIVALTSGDPEQLRKWVRE